MPAMAELRSEQPQNFQHFSPMDREKTTTNGLEPSFINQAEPDGQLMQLDWAAELRARSGTEPVMTAGALLSPDSKMPADHLFTALLRHSLVHDLTCLYEAPEQALHTMIALSDRVCGHGGLVHGGMTATVMDETLGALAYVLKRDGVIKGGPAFTAHLEVDYKKPLPSPCSVLCTARLASVDGRKIWVTAEVLDRPGGTLYASGKALFVVLRQPPAEAPAAAADAVAP